MAVSNELPVLQAYKALIEGLLFSPALTVVFIDPDDLTTKQKPEPPFVLVALNEGSDLSFSQYFHTSKKQEISLVSRFYLAKGHPIPQTEEYSAIRINARGMMQTLHDGINSDKKLGGTILTPIVNIDARMIYLSYEDDPYTGFEFESTVEQSIGF